MLHVGDLEELPRLPEPLLTAYLDTNPAAPRNQNGREGTVTWLRTAARELAAGWERPAQQAVEEQVARVAEFVSTRPGGGSKGLVALAGPTAWRMIPLQVAVEDEIYWGPPALGQLLWLLDEHQPIGVVVVSRQGARFFRYHMGEIEEDPGHPLTIDTSDWRHKGLYMGAGNEHDAFDRRKRDHYRHFFEHLAAECVRWSARQSLEPMALLGNPRAVETVLAALPEAFRAGVVSAPIQPARATSRQIIQRAEPLLEEWKRRRESADVAALLEQSGRPDAVTGVTATLAAMQEGRARRLLVARNLRGRLRQCRDCGWVDRSPQELCPQCGHERVVQSARALLPALARSHGVAVEIVAGAAAARLLSAAEGMAAWLRVASGEAPVEAPAA